MNKMCCMDYGGDIMREIFEETMKTYIDRYMKSQEGLKTMLLSMVKAINQKNLEDLHKLYEQNKLNKWQLDDIKCVSDAISNIIKTNGFSLAPDRCITLGNAVLELSELLKQLKYLSVPSEEVRYRTNHIRNNLDLSLRIMSREEFLSLNDNDLIGNETYDGHYQPIERAQESKLKKYGYSVAWNSPLSNKERQALLKDLIETGLVSKGYVITYLKHNIQINGKKQTNDIALSKWKEDLEFVMKL